MDFNSKFNKYEMEVLDRAEEEFGLTGKIDIACPRCGGKLKGIRVSTSYSIECENKCGIKVSVRGI